MELIDAATKRCAWSGFLKVVLLISMAIAGEAACIAQDKEPGATAEKARTMPIEYKPSEVPKTEAEKKKLMHDLYEAYTVNAQIKIVELWEGRRRSINSWFRRNRPADLAARTKIAFAINKNGSISNIRVKDTSRSKIVDFVAMQSILDAGPLIPFPEGFPENLEMEIELNTQADRSIAY